jgi:hypothetical protein
MASCQSVKDGGLLAVEEPLGIMVVVLVTFHVFRTALASLKIVAGRCLQDHVIAISDYSSC